MCVTCYYMPNPEIKCDVGGLVSYLFVEMSFKRKIIFSYKYKGYMWCISYICLVFICGCVLNVFSYMKILFSHM